MRVSLVGRKVRIRMQNRRVYTRELPLPLITSGPGASLFRRRHWRADENVSTPVPPARPTPSSSRTLCHNGRLATPPRQLTFPPGARCSGLEFDRGAGESARVLLFATSRAPIETDALSIRVRGGSLTIVQRDGARTCFSTPVRY